MIHELTDRPATRRIAIASVVLLLFAGIVAIATGTGNSGGVGDARLTTNGHALITAVNGQRRTVTGTVALHRGEIVESIDGAMTLELPDGSSVEGRPSFKRSDPTRVKVASPVELLAGDLLVTASRGADVEAGGNRVHLDPSDGPSAARVSRSLAVAASVFRGAATFDSAGQARLIPALRTLEVSALGRPPTSPSPLKVDETNTDPWERRFLGEAIDLGQTLANYSTVYTNTLGAGNSVTVSAYKSVIPSLADEADFTPALVAASPHNSGETFIGAAIASLSRRGTFADRWRAAFSFRDAGASWGFVALDQGVSSDPLLSAIQNALNATPFQFALAAQPPAPATTEPPTGGGPTTTPTTTPTTQPGGPTTTPPTTTLVPPTGSPLVDGIVKNVNDVLGGLLGGSPPGG